MPHVAPPIRAHRVREIRPLLPVTLLVVLGCSLRSEAASSPDPLDKPVITQSMFTYLGAFTLPLSANGWSTAFSSGGLALRYRNGNLQFFTTSHVYSGGLVYEIGYPGISAAAPYPQAPLVHEWGDVYGGHKWVGNGGGSDSLGAGVSTDGLYFDAMRNRLYWSYGFWYNTTDPFNPSIGYSQIDDAAGTATGVGAWSLTSRPEKFQRGGLTRIPTWFADRFTGGKTLGVGFGGYYSIIGTGSLGPALAAIGDPDPSTSPDRSSLDNVAMLGFPAGGTERGHRDPDYTSYYDAGIYPTTPGQWNPSNGVGYWTWSDVVGGGAWIDLPDRQGVVMIAKVGQGNVYYQTSDRHAQRGCYEWMVYNPKDLAAVASGTLTQSQVQPTSFWSDPNLPLSPLDVSGWGGDGGGTVGGVAFDPTTNRLYVLASSVWQNGVEWYPQVYVYSLGGPLGTTTTGTGSGTGSSSTTGAASTGGATTSSSGGSAGATTSSSGQHGCGMGMGASGLLLLLGASWHHRRRQRSTDPGAQGFPHP